MLGWLVFLTVVPILSIVVFLLLRRNRRLAWEVTDQIRLYRNERAKLHGMSEYNRAIIGSMPSGILLVDTNLTILHASRLPVCNTLRGPEDNQTIHDAFDSSVLLQGGLLSALRRVLNGNQAVSLRGVRCERPGEGEERILNITVCPVRYTKIQRDERAVIIIDDVTEQMILERRMHEADKLSATGRMLSAVAHEINNPLQAVRNFITVVNRDGEVDEENKEYLGLALVGIDRVASVVRQLLDLHRQSEDEASTSDVTEILQEVLRFLSNQFSLQKVEVSTDLQTDIPTACIPGKKLFQVFLNILLNALEAVDSQGELRVATSSDDGSVTVRFSDNGCGIPEEHLAQLFEPFFTTKAGGTGLGLSVCHSIIQSYDGSISVESQTEEGTTVVMTLPTEYTTTEVE